MAEKLSRRLGSTNPPNGYENWIELALAIGLQENIIRLGRLKLSHSK
jgi:hypothetical protein